ncbi:MAG TPA: hypothetical protein ENN12_05965 [Epsilonproteobacteria bacterium]|nr:hypothetical protein [Campylobacterota bacterium]
MDRCEMIKAEVIMEEGYGRLRLTFGDNMELKQEALGAIARVKESTNTSPMVIDRVAPDTPNLQSLSIEFYDDNDRMAGAFFTQILKELKIDKCEANV